MLSYFQGVGVGAGLIIAIGAQNAFVLSQGIRRHYPVQTAFVCSISDALLILLGITGVGSFLAINPRIAQWATGFAILFLLFYGWRAFRSTFVSQSLKTTGTVIPTRQKVLLATLIFTFLNPHVYLDTVVLMGSISGELAKTERYLFGAGAMTASFIWFFCLSLGAGLLAPVFRKPSAWRCLDGFVCLTMWGIACSLLWPKLSTYIG
jgi:L-lysine exporter family protein LysE/ArgO